MLLDTCTLLWLASTPTALPGYVRRLIADNAGNLFISAITAFEIGIKHQRGALRLPLSPADWIARVLDYHGVQAIAVDWRVAERSTALPLLHKDPADRIIIATSLATGAPIITPDRKIKQYPGVRVVWDGGRPTTPGAAVAV